MLSAGNVDDKLKRIGRLFELFHLAFSETDVRRQGYADWRPYLLLTVNTVTCIMPFE